MDYWQLGAIKDCSWKLEQKGFSRRILEYAVIIAMTDTILLLAAIQMHRIDRFT